MLNSILLKNFKKWLESNSSDELKDLFDLYYIEIKDVEGKVFVSIEDITPKRVPAGGNFPLPDKVKVTKEEENLLKESISKFFQIQRKDVFID